MKTKENNGLNNDKKKRLGQYPTGIRLARFLTYLAKGEGSKAIIDPMCGTGDMLVAVSQISPTSQLFGIEIDPKLYKECEHRVNQHSPNLIRGDAFSWKTISNLNKMQFDLVITNPPYVRYQNQSNGDIFEDFDMPSAESVRSGLLGIAEKLDFISDEDRSLFITLIRSYSGLSDLALPSWILCAMLTSIGGKLAMVVPESWLKRDYSNIIHYLLLKLFRIQWIVEDNNRVWFDAQVKTTLLVAERIHQVENLQRNLKSKNYYHISLPSSTTNKQSIVGKLYPNSEEPDKDFINSIKRNEKAHNKVRGYSISKHNLYTKLTNLIATSSNMDWFKHVEPKISGLAFKEKTVMGYKIPQEIKELLPSKLLEKFTILINLGWKVGQGLRTGSNNFYYCNLVEEFDEECLVTLSKEIPIDTIHLPKDCLFPVLRKQEELSNNYLLDEKQLKGRVLVLERYLLPEVYEGLSKGNGKEKYDLSQRMVMSDEFANFIRISAEVNVGDELNPIYIPQRSAVRTNESNSHYRTQYNPRFWYMLPVFARRHKPDLFVPRVNGSYPKVRMNSSNKTIIDANFSTLWIEKESVADEYAMLSMLNSTWIQATMELSGAILGGGALKLESTHLRPMPILQLTNMDWKKLSTLGLNLIEGKDINETLEKIDSIIASFILEDEDTEDFITALNELIENSQLGREK